LLALLAAIARLQGGEFSMAASAKPGMNSKETSNFDGDLPADYVPGADEPFMNERQLRFFEKQLNDWKLEILQESRDTLNNLQDGPIREPDLNDRASSETDWSIELRTRDRQRKLISKIDAALRRIEEGEYGYCQVTGEPISLARLRARPIATMTLEAQERHERQERVSRDD
jgi:DnaK suppressor protein